MIVAAIDWEKWVAIGALASAAATAFLALGTFWLVRATKRIVVGDAAGLAATKTLALAMRDQAQSAALALALQVEPRIVPVHDSRPRFTDPKNVGEADGDLWVDPLHIEIENVGAGVAQLTEAKVTVSEWAAPHQVLFPGVLRSGARATLRAEFPAQPASQRRARVDPGKVLEVRLHYRGAGGQEYEVAFRWKRWAGSRARWQLLPSEAVGHIEL